MARRNNYKTKLGIVYYLIFILFPFIQHRTYSDLPANYGELVQRFYNLYCIISATFIYFISLRKFKLVKGEKYIYLVLSFWSIYILSTLINELSSLYTVLFRVYTYFSLFLIIVISCKKWKCELLKALTIIYSGWIYLNFFCDLMFPSGLYTTPNYHSAHLLGDDNSMVYVMLPGLVISICYSNIKKGKIDLNSKLLITIISLTLLFVWAVSAFLSVFLFLLLFFFVQVGKSIDPRLLFVGLILAILLCLFGLSNPYISSFIEETLEKDITLTGRTVLWAQAIIDIIQRPILGYGGYYQYGSWIINVGDLIEYPCHTPYLQLLLDGGLCLFFVFLVIIISATEAARKSGCEKISGFLMAGLISMMFNYITEYSELTHLFIILALIFGVKELSIRQKKHLLYHSDIKRSEFNL